MALLSPRPCLRAMRHSALGAGSDFCPLTLAKGPSVVLPSGQGCGVGGCQTVQSRFLCGPRNQERGPVRARALGI